MDGTDFTIIAVAVALIALVNWYFLGRSQAPVAAVAAPGGVAAFTIRVEGGYSPNAIEVARGSRVRLTFDRQEDNPCSEEGVAAGTHQFACGMGMPRGTMVVK